MAAIFALRDFFVAAAGIRLTFVAGFAGFHSFHTARMAASFARGFSFYAAGLIGHGERGARKENYRGY